MVEAPSTWSKLVKRSKPSQTPRTGLEAAAAVGVRAVVAEVAPCLCRTTRRELRPAHLEMYLPAAVEEVSGVVVVDLRDVEDTFPRANPSLHKRLLHGQHLRLDRRCKARSASRRPRRSIPLGKPPSCASKRRWPWLSLHLARRQPRRLSSISYTSHSPVHYACTVSRV